jgi:hypothetical protein
MTCARINLLKLSHVEYFPITHNIYEDTLVFSSGYPDIVIMVLNDDHSEFTSSYMENQNGKFNFNRYFCKIEHPGPE